MSHAEDVLLDRRRRMPAAVARLNGGSTSSRDLSVFRMARARGIPIVFVVAGGYQQAQRVARLNANTVRAARHAWRGAANDEAPGNGPS